MPLGFLAVSWWGKKNRFLPQWDQKNFSSAMNKLLQALCLVSLLGCVVEAQTFEEIAETHKKCKDIIDNLGDSGQYEKGKLHARAWQVALKMKGWTEEEKIYLDTSRFTSRHGDGGMTAGAQLLIAMMYAKMNTETFNVKGKTNSCLLGEFSIYKSRDWSSAHKGFTENLSPDLKALYFSLPAR